MLFLHIPCPGEHRKSTFIQDGLRDLLFSGLLGPRVAHYRPKEDLHPFSVALEDPERHPKINQIPLESFSRPHARPKDPPRPIWNLKTPIFESQNDHFDFVIPGTVSFLCFFVCLFPCDARYHTFHDSRYPNT